MILMRYATAFFLLLFFAVFLLLPVYTVIEQGLNVRMLLEIFKSSIYVEGLLNSFAIAAVTTLMVFIIALPLAIVYDKFEFPGKTLANLFIMLPLILPPFVGALGFQHLLGNYGVFNTILVSLGLSPVDWLGGHGRFWSVCLIESLHLYPILYLNLVTALANIDPAMDEAGRNLGAERWCRFRKITLPLVKPGMLAGGSIVLIWSFTELGTPLMFGYNRVTTVQIFNGITELETNPLPYSLVLVMLVIAGGLYMLSRFAFGGSSAGTVTKGLAGSSAVVIAGWKKYLPLMLMLGITACATLPHFALILTAFSKDWYGTVLPHVYSMMHFENALSDKIVVPSILNSLKYSSLAMIIALGAGFLTALLVVRWKLKGAILFDMLSMLPLAVPGIIMAFGYLSLSVRFSWAREIMNPITNPTMLLAAAYAVRRLPYVVRAAAAGLEQTPVELEEAAKNLGASSFMTLRKITVPLISANLIVGALFAFSFSMLEVSDSLILAQKTAFYPVTKAIFELSQILGSGPYIACAFGVWAMLFLACTLGAASALLGKKMGALFRM
ncbi:MAG: iron ABC transporter permease [Lentisphaerota bacterium]